MIVFFIVVAVGGIFCSTIVGATHCDATISVDGVDTIDSPAFATLQFALASIDEAAKSVTVCVTSGTYSGDESVFTASLTRSLHYLHLRGANDTMPYGESAASLLIDFFRRKFGCFYLFRNKSEHSVANHKRVQL